MALGLTKQKKSKDTLEVARQRHSNAVGWLYGLKDELTVSSGFYDAAAEESSENYDAHTAAAAEQLARILEANKGKAEAQGTIANIDALLSPAPQVKIV